MVMLLSITQFLLFALHKPPHITKSAALRPPLQRNCKPTPMGKNQPLAIQLRHHAAQKVVFPNTPDRRFWRYSASIIDCGGADLLEAA
jgi:hypothetical protein